MYFRAAEVRAPYYATIAKVYILSKDTYPDGDLTLDELVQLCKRGDHVVKKIVTTDIVEITTGAMAEQLRKAGALPLVLGLDDDGNETTQDT